MYYRQQCPFGSVPYAVQYGDTLTAIARRFGTTVMAIRQINPGINPNMLYVGQIICVPTGGFSCPNGQIFVVQPGDTFLTIAIRFNISANALRRANPNIQLPNLPAGTVLCIPPFQPKDPCPNGRPYVIQQGDTLSLIAENFGVSATDILLLNPNLAPGEFVEGIRICIPSTQAPV